MEAVTPGPLFGLCLGRGRAQNRSSPFPYPAFISPYEGVEVEKSCSWAAAVRGKVLGEDGDVGIEVRVVVFPVPRLRTNSLERQ